MCCNAQNMKGWKTLIINVLFANTHIHSNTWLKSRNLYKIQLQKYLNSSFENRMKLYLLQGGVFVTLN